MSTPRTGRLQGKHALVTGGATGIGYGIAKRFVGEGARVVIASRNEERGQQAIHKLRGAANWRTLDITDAAAWRGLVDEFAADPIDALVNNAGGLIYARRLHEIEPDEWRREIDANLTGAFLGMRYVIPHMLANGGGSIINIGSIGGVRGQDDAAAYCAAKGGLRILTKNAAITYAGLGIRVNTINPGVIQTAAMAAEPTERVQPFIERTPMKRVGTPDDIAEVAVLLASDDASFITGADYDVDGGYDA